MAKTCEITGKKLMTGNNVSHSHSKTRRCFHPNLQKKRVYLKDQDRHIVLTISTSGLRLIDKYGLDKCLKDAREKGYLKR